ncbi:uncharacterized protein LOC127860795 [Dreissena polymorpha]|uniref:Uncharacterized protein n=1 Tax=Dreissena polymorpha TaxID=45954 RepID=A0A9D3YGS2_DREPO|nr:uncharacterized protein LOC127860795 [Dreissena polymorpha]KAH3699741.1 hypothetical protein DPMN_074703 [Dreissena polymorpha]
MGPVSPIHTCSRSQTISTSVRYRTATYCYYQCMLEVHDVNSGAVTDDCACEVDAPGGSNESMPTTTSIRLDPTCYSPDGTQCSWYRNCLEKRFPCKELEQSYALDYGEKFCNLYTDHYAEFDDVGQKWVNAVRKCLQVALVPLMRSFNTVPCEQIKDVAFESHTGCYVTPPDGAKSFCDIGGRNLFSVLATIKSAFWQLGTIWRTISQGYSTVWACMSRDDKDSLADKRNMMQFKAQIEDEQTVSNTVKMRFDLESAVSAHMDQGVFVYAFPERPDSSIRPSPENMTVIITNVLVLPRAEYDLDYHSNETVNVTDVVDGFLDGLADGSVQLSLPWPIQDIRQCNGIECDNSTRTVVPKTTAPTNGIECDNSTRTVVPKTTASTNDNNKADRYTCSFVIVGALVMFAHWLLTVAG